MTGTVPTLSILIPTHLPDRPLARCLESVAAQPLLPGDEVLVIGDETDGPLPEVEAVVASFGPQYRYLPCPGTVHQLVHGRDVHSYGHEQLSYGTTQARGAWLVYQDDDDTFLEGAFVAIRSAAAALPEPRPLMFRFVPWFRQLLWAEPVIEEHRVGGHNFVPPNIPERLAPWGNHYQGDYTHIRDTVDLWPNKDADVVWHDAVISLARPDQ